MRHQKIIVITGDQLRHRYFLQQIAGETPLAAAFIETTHYPAAAAASAEAESAWRWYFARREAYETERFRDAAALPDPAGPRLLPIARGEINSQVTLDRLLAIAPDLIVIFGTGLLGDRVLEHYGGRIFNLHLGLSQHYRGSSANFWPIHDEKPETLGATIHTVDRGIDTGTVLLRAPIPLERGDDEQTLAVKTLIKGCRMMALAIRLWKAGRLHPRPPPKMGSLRLMKNLTPEAMLRVRRMVESGELARRIEEVNARRRSLRRFTRVRGEC